MNEKRVNKRALLFVFAMNTLSSCSQMPIPDDQEKVSVEVKKNIVWEDLRIQKLLPGYMIIPAIEPYLPANFVALCHPEDWNTVYWGDRDVLRTFFEKGPYHLKSAIIRVAVSLNVAQIDENTFSDECSDSDLASKGIKNCVINKWKWGPHPVMSMDATMGDDEVNVAWIGLNEGGQVLCAGLIYPPNQHAPSSEDLNMWSEFLKKTKSLDEHAFYKAHGQDLREGFTLVNVYGSVLKVSAEKRMRDGKIQINIEPADQTISCKCLAVDQMLMPVKWHFFEPIVKIQSEIQVTGDANITSYNVITVLLKEVSEFSNNDEERNANSLSCSEYGNISIFNFCEQERIMQDDVLQN